MEIVFLLCFFIVVFGISKAAKTKRENKGSHSDVEDPFGVYRLYSRDELERGKAREKLGTPELKPIDISPSQVGSANTGEESDTYRRLVEAAERMAKANQKLREVSEKDENVIVENKKPPKKQISLEEATELRSQMSNEANTLRSTVSFSHGFGDDSVTYTFSELVNDDASKYEVPLARLEKSLFTKDFSRQNMLIGGTVGSGKSSLAKAILMWLCLNNSPEDLMVAIYDSRMSEYSAFIPLPHLIIPIISGSDMCVGFIKWLCGEVRKRQRLMSLRANVAEQKIIFVIDDIATLGTSEEWKEPLRTVLTDGYRVGINVIIVTSNPSSGIIPTDYKINIPLRVCFFMPSSVGYRLVLDAKVKEKYIAKGEALISDLGVLHKGKTLFIPDEVIHNLSDLLFSIYDKRLKKCYKAIQNGVPLKETLYTHFDNGVMADLERLRGNAATISDATDELDDMFEEAVSVVLEQGGASTAMLQRKLRLGYARCARIIDEMEDAGIIGPSEGSQPRKVLITKRQWLERVTTRDDG